MLHEVSPGLRRFVFATAALLAVVVALFAFSATAMAADRVVNPAPGCNDTTGSPSYCTITAAYTAAAAGDTIVIAPGTYQEAATVTVNKAVHIVGAGSGDDPNADTILIQNTANAAVLDFRSGASGTASVPTVFSKVRVVDTKGTGVNFGVGPLSDIKWDNVALVGDSLSETLPADREACLRVATAVSVSNFTVIDSRVEGCDNGWYIFGAANVPFKNVLVQDSQFVNNSLFGIYAEKMSDATFTNVLFDHNGFASDNTTGYVVASGLWIGGWWVAPGSITLNNVTATNNGLGTKSGGGIVLQYTKVPVSPAAPNSLTVNGGTFTGNERGIASYSTVPVAATVYGASFSGNVLTYTGTGAAAAGGLVNTGPVQMMAEWNWWGAIDGPSGIYSGSGDLISGNVDADPFMTPLRLYVAKTGSDSNSGMSPMSPKLTIQAAIDAVTAGGTVHVADGTYAGPFTIYKDLSLIGESMGGTILDSSAVNGNEAMRTNANIVLKNFTLKGSSSCTNNTCRGMKIEGNGFSTTIEDVTVQGAYRTQIDLNGQDGVIIKNVTVTGATKGTGIALSDVSNAVLENITTSGNAWGGVRIASNGKSPSPSNIVVKGSNSFGEPTPVFVELNYVGSASSYSPVSNVSVQGLDWAVAAFRAGTAEKQWWLFPTQAAADTAAASVVAPLTGGTVAQMLWPVDFTYPAADIYAENATVKFNTNSAPYTFDVPVKLSPAASVYSLGLDVNFPTCVTLGVVDGAPGGFGVYKETSGSGTAGIAVASDGYAFGALPAGTVAMLHFDATTCATDTSAVVSFGPRLQCGAADGINHVACTSTPGTVTLDFNEAPTFTPNAFSVNENVAGGSTVGTFVGSDPDGDPLTFSLDGGTDAAAFTLTPAGVLSINASPNFEVQSSYTFNVKVADNRGGSTSQTVTINVINVNEPPTGVNIGQQEFTVAQTVANAPLTTFTIVGDPDSSGAFPPYSCSIAAQTPPGSFAVSGLQLSVGADPLPAGPYTVQVTCTDGTNPITSAEFAITVFDKATLTFGAETSGHSGVVRKASGVLVIPVAYNANGNVPTSFKFRVNFDAACLAVASTPAESSSGSGWVQYDNAASMPELSVTALASCPDPRADSTTPAMRADKALSFSIVEYKKNALDLAIDSSSTSTAKVIDNSVRGNCNADTAQGVNAADYVATVLEIFDNTGLPGWLDAPIDGFDGSPFGCDSSQDGEIAANDIVCTVHESFNVTPCPLPGNPINPASAAGLDVAAVSADAGALLNVPLNFDAQGAQIGALLFTLKLDPARAAFDATDADGDGNPDAIHFNLVDGQSAVALYDAAAGKINVAVFSVTSVMQPINGNVASVSLQSLAGGDAGLSIESASASTVEGVSVLVNGTTGGQGFLPSFFNYLPTMIK